MTKCKGSKKKQVIRYTIFPTKYGRYFIAATDKGICKVHWPANDELRRYVERHFDCELVRDDNYLNNIAGQVKSYLTGERKKFDCKIDISRGTLFQKRVWSATMRIPYGETRSYGWIAVQAGSTMGFRAAGQACRNNPIPIIVPCHRVIGKDGSMTGYGGPSRDGQEMKKELLEMESVLNR